MADIYLTPEQVAESLQLGVETVYRWLRSGKLRGSRISQKAWRVEERDLRSFVRKQNVSELLFEEYVSEQQLGVLDREPNIPGKNRRLDYRLTFRGQPLWFEVKEFGEDRACLVAGGGSYDPYIGIRKKIDAVSKQFSEYPNESCSLILFNRNINLVDIYNPRIVLGAMLGNVSYRVPLDVARGGVSGAPSQFFAQGSRLIDPRTSTAQNTRISAVISLERLAVGKREFRIKLAKKEREENRRLPWEETWEWLQREEAYERTALRVIVYENLYAAKRLPNDLFVGPYDVRWGPEADEPYITRLYAGEEIARLEEAENDLELDLGPLQRLAKRGLTLSSLP